MLVLSFRGDYLAHKMEILGADSSNKLKSYVYGATVKVSVKVPAVLRFPIGVSVYCVHVHLRRGDHQVARAPAAALTVSDAL